MRAFGVAQCSQARFDMRRSFILYHDVLQPEVNDLAIALEFRTDFSNGVLLYLGADATSGRFLSISIRNGKVDAIFFLHTPFFLPYPIAQLLN